MKIISHEHIGFDDVLLMPQYNEFSRREVNLTTQLAGIQLKIPILSANMDSITGFEMALAMYKTGGLGILHRYYDLNKLETELKQIPNIQLCISVTLNQDADKTAKLVNDYPQILGVCVDVAHGHQKSVGELIKKYKQLLNKQKIIIAGNIATRDGAKFLLEAGAHIIKCGIGCGSLCSTRLNTGAGIPQVSALLSVLEIARCYDNVSVIADGGCRTSGDITKCLALGASAVMLGSMLAGTKESLGYETNTYRGMASRESNEANGVKPLSVEGISVSVPQKGSVTEVIENIIGNIKSGLTYSGCKDLKTFQEKAKLVRVSPLTFASETRIHNPNAV